MAYVMKVSSHVHEAEVGAEVGAAGSAPRLGPGGAQAGATGSTARVPAWASLT
jgi:hypothetical protein